MSCYLTVFVFVPSVLFETIPNFSQRLSACLFAILHLKRLQLCDLYWIRLGNDSILIGTRLGLGLY